MKRSLLAGSIALLTAAAPLIAPIGAAQDVALGDLEIWYEERPMTVPGGTIQVTGKAEVPLTLDRGSGNISGSGKLPITIASSVGGCTSTSKGMQSLTVNGTKDVVGLRLVVTGSAVTFSLTVSCRGAKPVTMSQTAPGGTHNVTLPLPSATPVRVASSFPGVQAVLMQLKSGCDPQGPSDLLPVATRPPLGDLGNMAPLRLMIMTLDDVREEAGRPDALGLMRHTFRPKETITDQTRQIPDGVCYWVTKVDFEFEPVEVLIPGLVWGEESCEFKAIDQHEQKHSGPVTRLLRDFAGDLVRAVQTGGLPQADRPIRVDSLDEGRARVRARIADLIEPLRSRYLELRKQRATAVDTPAEYAAVRQKCPGGWRQ